MIIITVITAGIFRLQGWKLALSVMFIMISEVYLNSGIKHSFCSQFAMELNNAQSMKLCIIHFDLCICSFIVWYKQSTFFPEMFWLKQTLNLTWKSLSYIKTNRTNEYSLTAASSGHVTCVGLHLNIQTH